MVPDGRRIAFASVHNDNSDIFVMEADGTDLRQVTRDIGQNIHPMWSRDNSRILFNTTHFTEQPQKSDKSTNEKRVIDEVRDEQMDLATIRPDGSDLQPITHSGGFTYASFSPDGRFIVHRRQRGERSQIFLMNADGSEDHDRSAASTIDGWPAWSPDGKRIVFSRHTENGFQLFVMNRDGGAARQLTNAAGEFTNPRWSPDGRKILAGRRLGGISLVIFDAPNGTPHSFIERNPATNLTGRYATFFLRQYDQATQTLPSVNCGHNTPLLLRKYGNRERLGATLTLRCLFSVWTCSTTQVQMGAGYVRRFDAEGPAVTTGPSGEKFGVARLVRIRTTREFEAATIVRSVQAAAAQFRQDDKNDDRTLVVAPAR